MNGSKAKKLAYEKEAKMKKKLISVMLTAAMCAAMLVGCGGSSSSSSEPAAEAPAAEETAEAPAAEETAEAPAEEAKEGGITIGLSIQTLGNQVWAQQMDAIQAKAAADGNEAIVMDCNENANTQISQLENFITSGVDYIVVNPVDPNAIEEVCGRAMEAGIKVLCWDEEMENSDINWVISNFELGKMIGKSASEFINEKFGDAGCEVAVLGYPQTPILLQREEGIVASLEELAPAAKVVASQPAINPTEGLDAMETILQANPDVKVVCCIGGGGAAGANEAYKAKYGSEVPEDVGIFSTDLTDETIASIQNGEFNRVVVAITGNAQVCGEAVYDIVVDHAAGGNYDHNVYRDLIPVDASNLDSMI